MRNITHQRQAGCDLDLASEELCGDPISLILRSCCTGLLGSSVLSPWSRLKKYTGTLMASISFLKFHWLFLWKFPLWFINCLWLYGNDLAAIKHLTFFRRTYASVLVCVSIDQSNNHNSCCCLRWSLLI